MGAPAISTRQRTARKPRAAAGPRPVAKPRPATKPRASSRSAAATKPRTASRTAPRTTSRPRARTAPARSTRRARDTPAAGFAMIPVTAVGRTAVAFGGLADSGVVTRMTRSRAWIVVLGILLGGIVALNVWGLGLSAGGSATAAKIDALQRESSVARARVASRASNDRIEVAAAELGLAVPPPDGVHYLNGSSSDAEKAAERLANGRIAVAPPPMPVTDDAAEVTDPAAVVTDPTTVEPAATDPALATAPVTTTPTIDPATGAAIDPATGLPIP